MEIIKHGDSYKRDTTLRFSCRVCGCEFLANESEYVKYYYPESNYYYSEFNETDAHATCPECGATCITFNIKAKED